MKAVLVLEYDVDEAQVVEIVKNVAFVDEKGVRPRYAHILTDTPAYKILRVIEKESSE